MIIILAKNSDRPYGVSVASQGLGVNGRFTLDEIKFFLGNPDMTVARILLPAMERTENVARAMYVDEDAGLENFSVETVNKFATKMVNIHRPDLGRDPIFGNVAILDLDEEPE